MEIEMVDEWDLNMVLDKIGLKAPLAKVLYCYLRRRKNETIALFTNQVHYAIFKTLSNKPLTIYVSGNYVVLEFAGESRNHYYVLGINTDGKVFINKIRLPRDIKAKIAFIFKNEINMKFQYTVLMIRKFMFP
jgi:hypothetical protein